MSFIRTIFLPRRKLENYTKHNNIVSKGGIVLITDKPEFRFNDGETPGGLVIPIDKETHLKILEIYEVVIPSSSRFSIEKLKNTNVL